MIITTKTSTKSDQYRVHFDQNSIGALFRNNCVMSEGSHFIDFYIVMGSYVLVKFCLSFASLDCVRPVRPSISPIPKPINVKGNQGTSK